MFPSSYRTQLLLIFALLVAFFAVADGASLPLLARQVATAGINTDGGSSENGGAGSAQQSAEDAGNSISTGTGGSRSTPSSVQAFAQLLSGIFFGSLLVLFCGGALFVQIWHYYERFGRKGSDRVTIQMIVGTLLFFSLLQVIVLIHRVYDIHVAHFGNFTFPLLTVGWEVACSFVCIGIMSGLVQLYYAHRVWVAFHKSRVVFVVYAVLISFTFAGGIASAALIIESGSAANVKGEALRSFLPKSIPWQFSVVFASWLCSCSLIDVSLCACLIYQLCKMSTPFFHTRHAVARLLLLSLETCVATSTLSLISMILFLSIPYQSYYNILFLPIGQVTASSFLVTLMARPSIARELAQDQATVTPSGGINAVSSAAPRTLAKPVLKKLMRNEEKRRAKGDGTGVHLTTIIQEEHCSFDYEESNQSEKAKTNGSWDNQAVPDSPLTGGGNDVFEGRKLKNEDSSTTLSSIPSAAVHGHPYSYNQKLASSHYIGSIVTNGQQPDPAKYIAQAEGNDTRLGNSATDGFCYNKTPRGKIVRIDQTQPDERSCPWPEPKAE